MTRIFRFPRPSRLSTALAILLGLTASATALLAQGVQTPLYRWTTLAGLATTGSDDGLNARFNSPHGVAMDSGGNVYVADTANHTIRKITPQGTVSTLAGSPNQPGSTDGVGGAARFLLPEDVTVDASGNVYVADTGNYLVRKIAADGTVTTLAGQAGQAGSVDGPVASARFMQPRKIFVDNSGSVYVADSAGLRRISSGTVQTVSLAGSLLLGNGDTVDVATLPSKGGLAVDAAGQIYLSVGSNTFPKRILKRDAAGNYSILASAVASDNKPFVSDQTTEVAMTTDSAGNLYFVSQLISSIIEYDIYKISAGGTLSFSLLGGLNRGSFADAPQGLAVDSAGRIVHTNSLDDVVLQSTLQGSSVLAGIPWSNQGIDGSGAAARFAGIAGVAVDRNSQVYAADSERFYNVHYTGNAALRKISPTGQTSTLYSSPRMEAPPAIATGVALGAADTLFLGSAYAAAEFRQISPGGTPTNLDRGDFLDINAMGADSTGRLIVADRNRQVHRRSVDGVWSILAGANQPAEITDGVGPDARFSNLTNFTVAANGDVYALDRISDPNPRVVIRRIQPNGSVGTITGNLVKGVGISPTGIAFDAKGDIVLTYSDDTVRLLSANASEFIIGGVSSQSGVRDGDGQTARFYLPSAITTDAQNNIYLVDNAGVTVRKGEFLGYSALISSQPQSLTVAAGATAQFSVVASGTPTPSYQWQFNGSAISGATSSTLTIASAATTNAGSYTVVVTNSLGSVTSNAATLTVTTSPSNPPPSGGGGGSGGNSGGGGGGAPSLWFLAALLLTTGVRFARRHRYPV